MDRQMFETIQVRHEERRREIVDFVATVPDSELRAKLERTWINSEYTNQVLAVEKDRREIAERRISELEATVKTLAGLIGSQQAAAPSPRAAGEGAASEEEG